tara:strand:- start:994 stop:1752 length:759 start_codon:yes stop_codon:yes gene_type:complete
MNKHLKNGVIKSEPKSWTSEEIDDLLLKKKLGYTFKEIGKILNRTHYSCNRKYYKLMKKAKTYNKKHKEKKYQHNKNFIKQIEAKNILDVYSGGVSWWEKNSTLDVLSNDLYEDGADYKKEAIEFIFENRKKKFDIVDLDPFGSAFDCFDFAIQIAQKGLIITFGEIVGRRFNRKDFVEYRYNIKYIDDFNYKFLSKYIEERAKIYRKKLTPIIVAEMTNILRIYYKIDDLDYGFSGCKYFTKKDTLNLFNY